MATFNPNKRNTKKETPRKEKPVYEYEIKVTRVLNGKYDVLFDMVINNVTIYGCRVLETKDGTPFVGFPQKPDRKNRKKFWSIAYAPLTDEQTADVMRQICEQLEMEDEE